jgi:hypothetical protein
VTGRQPLKKMLAPKRFTPSAVILVLANLIPVFGVLFLRWPVFPLVFLFWLENVFIGIFNVFKMALVRYRGPADLVQRIFMIPFFCCHYGGFVAIHGVFVVFMIGGHGGQDIDIPKALGIVSQYGLAYAALFLFLSHGFSFVWNFLRGGERNRINLGQLMTAPYKRVIALHFFIIFGGFMLLRLNSPQGGILLLALFKIIIDLITHYREHRRRILGSR